ncbi:hypothetical protein [Haloarchaeobius sp. DFWS5]|uniref:hypothetical protein n=1 Tax=Haloarchaeobius sp. DFWS5 TaxID=3446114 RepID=UPI003EBBFEBB
MATSSRFARLDDPAFRQRWLTAYLWCLATLTWGVGDTVTTWAGIGHPLAYEAVPINAWALDAAGIAGVVAIKLVVLASLWTIHQRAPRVVRARYGYWLGGVEHAIPLGLFVAGAQLTLTNIEVLGVVG